MFKKILSFLSKFFKIIFPISFLIAVGIDAYYKFDIQDSSPFYIPALIAYSYFCFYLAVLLSRRIVSFHSWIIKLIQYFCLWAIAILVLDVNVPIPEGLLASIDFIILLTVLFTIVLLTLYFLYKVIFKNLQKIIFKFFRLLFIGTLSILLIFFIIQFFQKYFYQQTTADLSKPTSVPTTLIQPWQLNSRYKINKIVKFLKADLDQDGKEELAAITSYDQMPDEVFYYAGFYRYNPATEKWDEFYSEELNILNYSFAKDEVEPDKLADFTKTLIDLWSTKFTALENLGDLTGDGCPEIVFSSLLQGKDFENYLIVAQAGESHPYYKVFWDQRSTAEMVSEDGLLIEKFSDEKYDYKNILEWDKDNLRFKLIDSQKTKITVSDPPKVISALEEFST